MGMGGADLGFRVSQGGLLGATTALRRHASLNFRLAHREKRRAPARSTALSSGEPAMPAAGVDGRRGPPRRALGSVPVSSPGLGDVKIVEKPSRLTGETEEPRNKRRRRSLGLDDSASTASRCGAAKTVTESREIEDSATGAPSRASLVEGGAGEKARSNEALGENGRVPVVRR